MYTLVVNDTLKFNIDRFNESFNTNMNKSVLNLSAEDEVDERIPLTSLSLLANEISAADTLKMDIVVGDSLVIWTSDKYTLEDASLSLQSKSYFEEEVMKEKDFIVSSLTFSYSVPVAEEE